MTSEFAQRAVLPQIVPPVFRSGHLRAAIPKACADTIPKACAHTIPKACAHNRA
jgi:hypothetical protein